MQRGVFVVRFGQAVKGVGHARVGLGAVGREVERYVFQGAAAVVGAVVHVDDFQALVEQRDGRQDAVAVQAVGVQVVGLEVRGGDKAHAVGKQGVEQAVQDHGVRDVGHVEFVKTNQLVTLGHALAQHVQRVDRALQLAHFAVHLAHELVKVQTGFAFDGHGVKEAVHQKALAPPHPAEHVHTARDLGAVDEFFQAVGALGFVGRPVVGAALQGRDGALLGRVGGETPDLEFTLVVRGDGELAHGLASM